MEVRLHALLTTKNTKNYYSASRLIALPRVQQSKQPNAVRTAGVDVSAKGEATVCAGNCSRAGRAGRQLHKLFDTTEDIRTAPETVSKCEELQEINRAGRSREKKTAYKGRSASIPICVLNVAKRASNGTASCKNLIRHGAYKQADYRTDEEDDIAICLSKTPTHLSARLPTYLPTYLADCV